jgi:hypothetical protein
MHRSRLVVSLLVSLVPWGCAETRQCTLLGCANEGIDVDFVHTEVGTYSVDVTVDGTKTTCTATLPLDSSASTYDACTAAGIFLRRSGSSLPADQQAIGGLKVTSTEAKSITVKITRDGQVLHDATFAPDYVVTPGPNGPDCEPKECKAASFTLP